MENLLQKMKRNVRGGELKLPVVEYPCVDPCQSRQTVEEDLLFLTFPL